MDNQTLHNYSKIQNIWDLEQKKIQDCTDHKPFHSFVDKKKNSLLNPKYYFWCNEHFLMNEFPKYFIQHYVSYKSIFNKAKKKKNQTCELLTLTSCSPTPCHLK